MHAKFCLKSLKGRDHFECLGEDEKIITDFREIGWEDLGWIYLAQDRIRGGLCEQGNESSIRGMVFLDQLSVPSASEEGLCCMELGTELFSTNRTT
jgi:hypothetical protein